MILKIILFLFGVVLANVDGAQVGVKRQAVYPAAVAGVVRMDDQEIAGTGFVQAVQTGSKYFQDIYKAQLSPGEIEFGHVRETPDDWEQRFEKINLKSLAHQGKVRWGDKHGGYGEHYWDYNHGGAGDEHESDGAESQKEDEYVAYEGSEQAPVVSKPKYRRGIISDVEFINERARSLAESGGTNRHGGNYQWEPSE